MFKKKTIAIVAAIILLAMATCSGLACEIEESAPRADLPTLNNDLSTGKLVIESLISGESFIFTREYSTSYNAENWRITDSKTLNIRAWVENVPDGTVILVEHAHYDICLKSTEPSLDGLLQDTMDDSIHGADQSGFWVTTSYPYENIFAIEGYSQTLIDGWMFCWGGWGSGEVREKRLTEDNLVGDGEVYGNKVQVVYDLLIKSGTDPLYHTRSVVDEFLIPVSQ